MYQIFFVSLCCDHSEDGDRVYSSLPYGLVLSKHISRLEYTLCDNPLVEPVSDLTTDNTKVRIIYEATKHSPMFILWVMNMTHRHVNKFGTVDNFIPPWVMNNWYHVMLITLVVYVIGITSPPYIRLQTGEDPIVSRLVYIGGVPSIPPYMG
jgi:hypothetical protein